MTIVFSPTDFIIVAGVALWGYLGYRAGLYNSLLSLFGFYLAVTISLITLPYVAHFFGFVLQLQAEMSVLLSFAFVFGTVMFLYVYFKHWMHQIVKMAVTPWFDRLTGTLLGIYRGILSVSLIALAFTLLPRTPAAQHAVQYSMLFNQTRAFLPITFNFFNRLIPYLPGYEERLNQAYKRMGKVDESPDS